MESAFKLDLWWPIPLAFRSFMLSVIGYFMLRKSQELKANTLQYKSNLQPNKVYLNCQDSTSMFRTCTAEKRSITYLVVTYGRSNSKGSFLLK